MNAIVVVDRNWAIGRENDLLFSLPTDMKHFRNLTTGCTVILGRKTLDTFPGGNPLPNRRNIVVTRNPDFKREGCEVAASPEAAVKLAAKTEESDKIWVIGGGSIYTPLLSRCKHAFLTKVEAAAEDSDTYFPNLDKLPFWKVFSVSEPMTENGLTFRFVDYVNTKTRF